jgi:hypothetical protein
VYVMADMHRPRSCTRQRRCRGLRQCRFERLDGSNAAPIQPDTHARSRGVNDPWGRGLDQWPGPGGGSFTPRMRYSSRLPGRQRAPAPLSTTYHSTSLNSLCSQQFATDIDSRKMLGLPSASSRPECTDER